MSQPPIFVTFLLFILGKKLLEQIDVEFDFSMGHALVILQFYGHAQHHTLYIINKQNVRLTMDPRTPEINIYQYIY